MKKPMKKAVMYLRMSSDQQELSLGQQRAAVMSLAQTHDYEIVGEYKDEGKSGSKLVQERKSFLKMIADSNYQEWEVILVWDIARWGRLDPLKSAQYKDTLRTNNVYIHSVVEGVIRWDTFTDYVIDAVLGATANEYAMKLSKETIRGRLDQFNRGVWINGHAPYGYRKLFISPTQEKIYVDRHQNFRKPKYWQRELVVNEEEAVIVRHIFDRYVNHDESVRYIASKLTCLRPDGKSTDWNRDSVRLILMNKVYCGYNVVGGYQGTRKLRCKDPHNRFGYHEKRGAVIPIVSEEIWQAAMKKIHGNGNKYERPKTEHSAPLSGLLKCGHCGYTLEKKFLVDKEGNRQNYYVCSSGSKRPTLGCSQWRVYESMILPLVIDELINCVDAAVLESSRATPSEFHETPVEALQIKLSAIKKKIERGEENFLMAPKHRIESLKRLLSEWEAEQEEVEKQIKNLTTTKGELSLFARWWTENRTQLVKVREARNPDPSSAEIEIEDPESLPQGHSFLHDGRRVYKNHEGKVYDSKAIIEAYAKAEPSLHIDKGRFRTLLKELGFFAKVFWEKKPKRTNGSWWKVCRIEISTRTGDVVIPADCLDGSEGENGTDPMAGSTATPRPSPRDSAASSAIPTSRASTSASSRTSSSTPCGGPGPAWSS